MRVISEGRGFQPLELTCTMCTARLEAEKPEDFQRSVGDDQRDPWDYAVTRCPCCGNQIIVKKDNFPVHVYERLPRFP